MGWRNESASTLEAGSRIKTQAFKPTGVLGLDVASYQRKLNWAAWARRGKDFAYIKATEGTSYPNPYCAQQYYGSDNAGLIRGSYTSPTAGASSGETRPAGS